MKKLIITRIGNERWQEIVEENNRTARLGLAPLWELAEDHPFHPAGVEHDLAYLAAYELVRIGEPDLAVDVVKIADKEFKETIYKLANENGSLWLKFQARLFSGLVSIYGSLRFKD
jgi:hypothetical protein